ncbi:glycosyltransferase [Cognataquiflexum aquatile]|uniref:glycosyltransferase n=1 Tax=Cognataquiflexum aquatile TaxID=2249427 RepID=UPI000DEA51D3|nr:glycosyltransferase [Cognataquiflexum aquatile]
MDQSSITLSVCMITYKHSEFLATAIEGVLIQETNFKVELIISDDASPDRTEEVVQKYLNKSNGSIEIVYHKHSINMGAIPNFEWTLKQCSGKYIAICEGDDYWTDPDKLQRQVDFLENNSKYVLSFHDRSVVNTKGELLRKSSLPTSIKRDLNFSDLAQGVFTVPTQTVVFRNCIRNFPKDFSSVLNGDTFLFLLLAEKGSFYYEKEISGTSYRVHNGGVWSSINYEKSLKEAFKTYNFIYNHFNKNPLLSRPLLNRRFGLLSYYWKKNKIKNFTAEFKGIVELIIVNPKLSNYFLTKSFKYLLSPLRSKRNNLPVD